MSEIECNTAGFFDVKVHQLTGTDAMTCHLKQAIMQGVNIP